MTSAAVPQSGAVPADHHGLVASAEPIPFRKTSIASTPEVFGALMTTVLVLAIVAAAAWYARRQGWLDRWTGGVESARDAKRSLAVLEVLRISRKTTLYRVGSGGSEFLIAESSAPIQLAAVRAEAERLP